MLDPTDRPLLGVTHLIGVGGRVGARVRARARVRGRGRVTLALVLTLTPSGRAP